MKHKGLALALLISVVQLATFALLDRRPPDDHDDFYTADCLPSVHAFADASWLERPGVLAEQFGEGPLHPRLAQTVLIATLGTVGLSRSNYRLANLPFLLLLVFGTWLLARELGCRWPGVAAIAVAATPVIVNASRKWDLQFHAASLTPLGLCLGLVALRRTGRAAWAAWLVFGLWQGMRALTHPVTLPDVVVTLGLAALLSGWAGRSQGVARGARLGPVLAGLSAAGWVGLWYSGLGRSWLGAPDWSFDRYLEQRQSYAEVTWASEASPIAWAGLLVELMAEISWIHLFPLGLALVLPGLVGLPRLLANAKPHRARLLLPLGALLAQIPIAIVATSNRAFLNDWLFAVPALVVVSLLGLEALAPSPRALRSLAALFGLHVAFALPAPLLTSLIGPEPVLEPAFYDRLPLRVWTRSTSGRMLPTPHVLSRFEQPIDVVAAQLAAAQTPSGTARLELVDLAWDPARGAQPGCQLARFDDPAAWSWSAPDAFSGLAQRPLSAWPFAFVGFEGLTTEPADAPPRFAVVRLWVAPTEFWADEETPCRPVRRLPEGTLGEARRLAEERLVGRSEQLWDPGGSLIGQVISWDHPDEYLGALLVDRSAGQVQAQLD